jgi:hypothetical protein
MLVPSQTPMIQIESRPSNRTRIPSATLLGTVNWKDQRHAAACSLHSPQVAHLLHLEGAHASDIRLSTAHVLSYPRRCRLNRTSCRRHSHGSDCQEHNNTMQHDINARPLATPMLAVDGDWSDQSQVRLGPRNSILTTLLLLALPLATARGNTTMC